METNFSFHAYERVLGRMSMTHGALAELLDSDLAINIGEEAATIESINFFIAL